MDIKQISAGVIVGALLGIGGGALKVWKDVAVLQDQVKQNVLPDLSAYALKTDIPPPVDTSLYAKKNDVEEIPVGIVVYVRDTVCPNENWRVLENARGRYIVGLSKDGILGRTVGSSLIDGEVRQVVGVHTHKLNNTGIHEHPVTGVGNHQHAYTSTDNGSTLLDNPHNFDGGARRFGVVGPRTTAAAGSHSHTASASGSHEHTVSNAGSSELTAAPYVQLLACEKVK